MSAVDTDLAVHRAAGFVLVPIEGHLRPFARMATARAATHGVASTAIAWATMAPSEARRQYRLQTCRSYGQAGRAGSRDAPDTASGTLQRFG